MFIYKTIKIDILPLRANIQIADRWNINAIIFLTIFNWDIFHKSSPTRGPCSNDEASERPVKGGGRGSTLFPSQYFAWFLPFPAAKVLALHNAAAIVSTYLQWRRPLEILALIFILLHGSPLHAVAKIKKRLNIRSNYV